MNQPSRRSFLIGSTSGLSSIWLASNWPGILDARAHAQQAARQPVPLAFFTKEQAADADKYAAKCKRGFKGIAAEARSLLMQYSWPGNVRELENAIEHAVVMGLTTKFSPKTCQRAAGGAIVGIGRGALPQYSEPDKETPHPYCAGRSQRQPGRSGPTPGNSSQVPTPLNPVAP